jgi:hypothetical protein
METYSLKTKQVEKQDMRKAENRKSQWLGCTVVNGMTEIEKQYVNQHIMFDDFKKCPKNFEFQCLSNGMVKAIYDGKFVIINDVSNFERKTVQVKIAVFATQQECDDVFYTLFF